MKAEELRIGNWVLERFWIDRVNRNGDYIYTPTKVGVNKIHQVENYNYKFKPIQLTEEILLKCGAFTEDFLDGITCFIKLPNTSLFNYTFVFKKH